LLPPVVLCCNAKGIVSIRDKASIHTELLIGGNEWSMSPVKLDPPIVGSPILAIPNGAVDSHWLRVRVVHPQSLPVVLEHTDRSVVHVKHNLPLVPQNRVLMKISCGVEPEVNPLLPLALPTCAVIHFSTKFRQIFGLATSLQEF